MISVIVPVYNGEKHINKLIESFNKQSEKDFEIIFVNDGSRDNSLYLLNEAKDNSLLNITVIDQRNSGVSAARNAGVDAAKGEFISFCDMDDEISDSYLSDMHQVMKSSEVDMVICKYNILHEDGTVVRDALGTGSVTINDSISCLKDFLYKRIMTNIWSLMIRKDILTKNNLRFAEGFKYGEDEHMVWRLIALSKNIAYLDKSLYNYYIHQNSVSSKFTDERFQAYELMKSLSSFMENNVPDFASEYKRFAASKIIWSLTWQASTKYTSKNFKQFIKTHEVNKDMKTMVTFKSLKVSLSSLMFIISKSVFRKMAIRYGSKTAH